jgi:prepilin-type N-terminal cleavage/methylation domain-containing protein
MYSRLVSPFLLFSHEGIPRHCAGQAPTRSKVKPTYCTNKLKAFTLLELLVGMIVSGIVVAACFNAYRVVTLQFKAYKTTSAAYENFSFFESQFRADFQQAKEISGNEHTVQFISREKKTGWQFREKYALRNDGNVTDTFFVKLESGNSMASDLALLPRRLEDTKELNPCCCLKLNINEHSCEMFCIKETTASDKVNAEFEKMIDDGN